MSGSHQAAGSAVGYLYQVQWGLLEALRAAHDRPNQALSFERLDDIAWEEDGTPEELLQLKHHKAGGAPVSDKSVDVWRTIQVWLDHDASDQSTRPTLFLITTEVAAENSALNSLRPASHDPVIAERRLTEAARTSTSAATEATRRRYLELSDEARRHFVGRVIVLDSSPQIEDVVELVRRDLKFALPAGHEDTFLGLLWSWWYSVALDMLRGRRTAIRAIEVAARVSDLRDQFSRGNLPTLVPNLSRESGAAIAESYRDYAFVHQMRWVRAPDLILEKAVIDYYRAVSQAHLWVEDDLIGLHELQEFERNLVDEWEREMAWRLSDLPDDCDEDAKIAMGWQLLRDILNQTKVRVRERYNEPFFARGKLQELADSGEVGWHPDFEQRLAELLVNQAS